MKYDLIVAGAGPSGLTAAKTAARDNLKVLVIERKQKIDQIDRADSQIACISFNPLFDIRTEPLKYGYLEPISLVVNTHKTMIDFPAIGYSIEYKGPIRPYFSWICHSPSGYRIFKEKNRFYAFWWSKEALVSGLLDEAKKAGAEFITGTVVTGAENIPQGVLVHVQDKVAKRIIEAKKLISADGWHSKVVTSLGLNKKPVTTSKVDSALQSKVLAYVLDGVDCDYSKDACLEFAVPSINRSGPINMVMWQDNTYELITGTIDDIPPHVMLDKFMELPTYKSWFRNAKIIDKKAYGGPLGIQQVLLREPCVGNVLITSDATGLETTNPGAIACGFQSAKAVLKELNGENGFKEYTQWFVNSFEAFTNIYHKAIGRFLAIHRTCSDEEVDFLFSLFKEQVGFPEIMFANNLEILKDNRPELYHKLKDTGIHLGLEKQKLDSSNIY